MNNSIDLLTTISKTLPNHRVFVYGTLMNGECNNYLLQKASYCGQYMLENYALYDLGDYPGIIPETGSAVIGELWLITPDMLPILHELEEESELYKYTPVEIHQKNNKLIKACAYVYLGSLLNAKPVEIANQPWKQNTNK